MPVSEIHPDQLPSPQMSDEDKKKLALILVEALVDVGPCPPNENSIIGPDDL